jgi:hypothetical protein
LYWAGNITTLKLLEYRKEYFFQKPGYLQQLLRGSNTFFRKRNIEVKKLIDYLLPAKLSMHLLSLYKCW